MSDGLRLDSKIEHTLMASAMVLANGVDHCRAGNVDHLTLVDNFHAGLLHGREHLRSVFPILKLIMLSFE